MKPLCYGGEPIITGKLSLPVPVSCCGDMLLRQDERLNWRCHCGNKHNRIAKELQKVISFIKNQERISKEIAG